MPLTRKGAATKRRIIEGAAEEFRDQGVFSLRLEDVMARTATSKSQLFHYFPGGKDELLLAVARHEADRVIDDQQPELGSLTSWAAWWEWRDKVVARYREQGENCPLHAAVSQLGSATDAARSVARGLLGRWQDQLAAGIRHMQGSGEVVPGLDADREAAALLAGVQGGVMILMTTGGMEHLEAALDRGIAHLRGSGDQGSGG
ncbi:TetR/AcrR family transcriptional regulator [Streptomyces albireticuli]|uniref:TetR family transcriptional regulator n=1 Tax=Streptomyces albireticuli TaxID=1940 RepID=A0A2A2DC78_9ACTN|nr:TetR/AcrR family transcriptional regulator [Streptomyces albireticuli]MCD9141267.1 TetR/AcrR family transcriptional regulator [Streptomyces albireticuli]MCD9160772.1 TetR/AcrR family transcriptional regulator [Streptomyces albireticuli]MCD9191171.1 TetR/AcrR family transcriptional regulator [Streptomyces albireticuli]PAU49046.1 TetR family transcriptional regulator [Streptomyces albireticuli]